MKKRICKILAIIVLTMFTLTTISFAKVQIYVPEKTEAYEKWEKLSTEEKENAIEPRYYSLGIKESLKRSKYNTLLGGNTSLGESFDLSKLYQTIIKDQKRTGTCWAFSATSMLESTVAVRNGLLRREYSPLHMEYLGYQMYNKPLGYGGNMTMAMAIMINGRGPVLESDFSMDSVYDTEKNSARNYYLSDIENVNLNQEVQLKITKTTDFPPICKIYDGAGNIIYNDGVSKIYTQEQVNVAREKIKEHIKNYGAVAASMYINVAINNNQEFVSPYYDSENNIFCCTDSSTATLMNHQVAIVGWDDSKNAYIVQNSYGEAFGDKGYFYVSYDDTRIEENIYGINNLEDLTENKSYDNIYFYDELGMNYGLKFSDAEAYYANVFSRDTNVTDKDEYINEVGLYIMDTTGIEIYINSQDGEFVDKNKNSKLKLVHSGEILEPGYHVIKINATRDTKLTGEKFIVAVKSINQEGASLPIEANLYDCKFSSGSTMYDTATANNGESLYSTDGINWNELNGTQVGAIQILKNTNACVRAFTKYTEKAPETILVTGIELDKTSLTLKEGETENLIAAVLPEDATNKNVTWKSSNESVATVANGVVTAIEEGDATITVTTADGNYTASAAVTVEEKKQEEIKVTGVTLDKNTDTLKIGETLSLTATILPENATNKNVTWKSSDVSIATVSSGVVTALSKGTATITVETEDGKYTDTVTVIVKEIKNEEVKVESIEIDKKEIKMEVSDKSTLVITFNPELPTNTKIKWESSNTKVATVDENGIVTAVGQGTAVITATSEDGGYVAKSTITVTKKINDPDDIYKGETGGEDGTISKDPIPQAGIKGMLFITLVLISIMGISFTKYRNLKDVK